MYRKGARVILNPSEGGKVSHLLDQIGTIEEVPVHPNTWFKLIFPNGETHKFRATAFRLAPNTKLQREIKATMRSTSPHAGARSMGEWILFVEPSE